jgi:5-methylcytosine-specific restriction enzyme A
VPPATGSVPTRLRTPCSQPGCANLSNGGRCDDCAVVAEAQRGNFRQRGYRRGHDNRFRRGVLERDVNCVLCVKAERWVTATVADHWPLSRRELVARGLDPDDPQHGRGLCDTCHNQQTAEHQPGGWNAER